MASARWKPIKKGHLEEAEGNHDAQSHRYRSKLAPYGEAKEEVPVRIQPDICCDSWHRVTVMIQWVTLRYSKSKS